MASGDRGTTWIRVAERECRDQWIRGWLDIGLQIRPRRRLRALGPGTGQDALQNAGCTLEQVRIRSGNQDGCSALRTVWGDGNGVSVFGRGRVPVGKAASRGDDGQHQQGCELSNSLSSSLHPDHRVPFESWRDYSFESITAKRPQEMRD